MPKIKKEFKYHSTFASVGVRCPISKETSKYLSKASIEDLKDILPTVAQENGWDDLLAIAGNACVVNYANKNRDAINTAAALAIAPFFADKYINVEHDRNIVIGCIKNASFSTFNSNYMVGAGSTTLAAEDAAKMTSPFNLALGGIVWRVIAPSVADKIEECNNPDSPDWMTLGMSWELGFDDYAIAVGPQNIEECRIISDPAEVEAMSKYLVQNKGPGTLEDGTGVYRLLTETSGAVPLGIGLTFAPAAAVTGVVTPAFEAQTKQIEAEIKEKVSHSSTPPVITTKPTKLPTSMKVLKTLADVKALNDENKAEFSLANIQSVLLAEVTPTIDVQSKVTEYQQQVDNALKAQKAAEDKAKEDVEKASKAASDLTIKHENLQKQFDDLLRKQNEAEAVSKYNERMTNLDAEYELDDAQRTSIAESIRGLADEDYSKWLKNFSNFASKSKKTKTEDKTENTTTVATAAVEGAKKNTTTASTLNNNPTPPAPSLQERMKGAFTGDNAVKITADSRRGR